MEFSTFGRQVAADTWGVQFHLLNDVDWLEQLLVEAATRCGATVLSSEKKKFEPQGATVLVMLSESHVTIHTYPEKGFAAIDCYTCGEDVDPQVAVNHIVEALQPERIYRKLLIRGVGEIDVVEPHPQSASCCKKLTIVK